MKVAVALFTVFVSITLVKSSKPNILIFLTDDQDSILHGMFPLKKTQQLLRSRFTNAFTTSPLCCPSRASLLSGKYAHNHRTTNNSLSGGCNGEHWKKNISQQTLPVMLQRIGYNTFFAGKYLNQFRGEEVPPGWSQFFGLHGNSRYYNYTLRENAVNKTYTDTYFTDLIKEKGLDFFSKHAESQSDNPFFAMIAPPAPHQPFIPAERHRNAFAGIKALRTPNFNKISQPLEKHWIVSSSQSINPNVIELIDTYFQQRWETLLAVDELVADILERLNALKLLDNTFVIFTSDNGYHLGQFAQPYDKRQPYETDIHIPFLFRGPGIRPGQSIDVPIALIDVLPTVLEWAGVGEFNESDGQSFNEYIGLNAVKDVEEKEIHRSLLVQYWGEGDKKTSDCKCSQSNDNNLAECTFETDCHCQDARNNTYACIRHFRGILDRLYCEFKDEENFVEAYDLVDDPYQMSNLGYELLPIERAFYSLALKNLTNCAGSSCKNINI